MSRINIVRIVVGVIVIILLILAIVYQSINKIPQEWANMGSARQYNNTKVAPTNLQTNLTASDSKYSKMAKLVLIALVDKHCSMLHCDRNENPAIRFFIKSSKGLVYYLASLEAGQYQTIYITPANGTLIAELTQQEDNDKNSVEVDENKAVTLGVDLTSANPTMITATHTQGALANVGALSLSQISTTQAAAYLQSASFTPADDDPIVIDSKNNSAPLYEGVVQTRGYHYNLEGFRLIRCNVSMKSGDKITCIYDFFRNDANNNACLITKNSNCPVLNTILKNNDLGLDVDCYFIGLSGYTGSDTTGDSASLPATTNTGNKVDSSSTTSNKVDSNSSSTTSNKVDSSATTQNSDESKVSAADSVTGSGSEFLSKEMPGLPTVSATDNTASMEDNTKTKTTDDMSIQNRSTSSTAKNIPQSTTQAPQQLNLPVTNQEES
jgi:hypothetical protein